ncbi:hypothetical protein [uncultured Fibrella sp.]|uniref:hypothetical protein n=1 Tax=uncultured Fibrella sp. TaxID=1284596 RepID=UPI0035CBBA47
MANDDLYIHYSEVDGALWESHRADYDNHKYKLLSDDSLPYDVSGIFCRGVEEKHPQVGSIINNPDRRPPYPKFVTIQQELETFLFWHQRIAK